MKGRLSAQAIRQMDDLFRFGTLARLSDGQLLERFADRRDEAGEAAFSTLLERHGPMVLGVCRRVLGDLDAAEDAFQATFLMLANRAGSIRNAERLAPWLHRVARRTAQRARAKAIRDREAERQASDRAPICAEDRPWDDLRGIIDEEIDRLPRSFRDPVTLCYLEGLTHEAAALRLRCPVGTVRSRLARARDRLRDRLARRGLAPTAALLPAALTPKTASSAVPLSLIGPTTRAAMAISAGQAITTGTVPAAAVGLLNEGIKAMLFQKLRIILAVLLVAGSGVGLTVTTGAGGMAEGVGQEKETQAKPNPPAPPIDDHQAIQGEWKVVGSKLVNLQDNNSLLVTGEWSIPVTITADRITFNFFNVPNGGSARYELDPTTTPKQMRYTPDDTPNSAPAIYELNGNTLKLCIGRGGDAQPPRSFDINDRRPDEFPALFVLERIKPEQAEAPDGLQENAKPEELEAQILRLPAPLPGTRMEILIEGPEVTKRVIPKLDAEGRLLVEVEERVGDDFVKYTIRCAQIEIKAIPEASLPRRVEPGPGSEILESISDTTATPIMPVVPPQTEGWGTLKGQVIFEGEPPTPRVFVRQGDQNAKDSAISAQRDIVNESLLVDMKTKGVQNAFVYLVGPSAIHPDAKVAARQPAEVQIDRTVFEPHALALLAGDEIKIQPDQAVDCVFHPLPRNNLPFNKTLRPGVEPLQFRLDSAEPRPFQVVCDIHPWQSAYWMVTDHPYIAVTDSEGNFEIEQIPTGTQRVAVWQESVGFLTPKDGEVVEIRDGEATTTVFTIEPKGGDSIE